MTRKSEYPINDLILNRWSPRSMTGEEMSDEELMPLFEAAKWAPTSFNNQLTRFVYAKKGTEHWDPFFNLLAEPNQAWCKNASALVIFISRKVNYRDGSPQPTHSFEAGAAFENLALEASNKGFVCHGMAGFDFDKAKEFLGLDDKWTIECMVAIGKLGKKEDLPEPMQGMENPSDRLPLSKLAFEGKFEDVNPFE